MTSWLATAPPCAPRAPGCRLARSRPEPRGTPRASSGHRPTHRRRPPSVQRCGWRYGRGVDLALWWNSMISAVSKCGAASSAMRIIVPHRSRFGAIRAFDDVNAARNDSRSSSLNSVVPTTAMDAVGGGEAQRLPCGIKHGEVDDDVGSLPGQLFEGVVEVDTGHQFGARIGVDGATNLLAHLPCGSDNSYTDHVCRLGRDRHRRWRDPVRSPACSQRSATRRTTPCFFSTS